MGRSILLLILTTILAGVSQTEMGLLRLKRQLSNFPYQRRSGGLCRHGGTPVPALSGEHMFCLCTAGYGGKHCELYTSATCYTGTGMYYRGKVSRSVSGRVCVGWDLDTRQRLMGSDVYSGRHNYCRNLEYKRRPWCYVMKGGEPVQEYCDIPRCGVPVETGPLGYLPTEPMVPEPGEPMVPEPGEPMVPDPGEPMVTDPGEPMVPEPGEPMVPDPGEPMVPDPGESMVPEPGEAMVPEPVEPMVPEPGEPMVPDPGEPIVPDPGEPIVPDPGEPMVPDPGEPMVPDPGEPMVPDPGERMVSDPASTCGQRTGKQMKIVGGTVATVESHPWMAAIFWRSMKSKENVFRCGGSLISPCWVLSAAHCFPDSSHTKACSLFVTLGKSVINATDDTKEQMFQVEEVIVHAEFDNSEGNFNNDIALLKLKAIDGQCAVETSSVRTVCLPPARQALNAGSSCEIAGYGRQKEGLWYNSQYLREAKVNLLANVVCSDKEYYGNLITENMLCAGRPDWSQDACKGDSGGPMVCEVDNRMFLFGIVSWGEGCSRALRPGVYTTVTNYNKWIEDNTGLSSIASGSMYPQK